MAFLEKCFQKSSSQEPAQPASDSEVVVENLENKPLVEAIDSQEPAKPIPEPDAALPKNEEISPAGVADNQDSQKVDTGEKLSRPIENHSSATTPNSMEGESVEDELLPNYTAQLDSLQGSLAEVKDVVENLQYNVSILVQNQSSAADVAAMRRENEAFRSDSNMKLMRRYGIDAMIKTYQTICDKLFRIDHPLPDTQYAEGEKVAFEWVLKRMERQFKQLGIRLQRSETGSEFDGAIMAVYGSEGEDVEEQETIFETNEESLKDTVKESVCPAFMWTIPSIIGDAKEWCMESEKVCVYK